MVQVLHGEVGTVSSLGVTRGSRGVEKRVRQGDEKLADIEDQLEALQPHLGRLDDPTVGLTALHGELVQGRQKISRRSRGASPGYVRRTGRSADARTG